MYNILKKSKQRRNKKRIIGFDIETYDSNKKFLLASLWESDDKYKFFFTKSELISELLSGRYKDTIIVATNLSFDFFGSFLDDCNGFNFIFRGSELIYAKTYVYNGKFNRWSNHHKTSITFLDTMNYARLSVEKLGNIINVPKLKSPSFIGKLPSTDDEWDYMRKYNLNDSKISCLSLRFFYKAFEELGASPKLTLASTAMSLYRNVYLKDDYFRHDEDVLLDLFKGYYGGRTEAFSRGNIENYNYYDFNSLYPSVMTNRYPDPNSLCKTFKNTDYYINNFEGMSEVTINCPSMDYPLLPVRISDKLIFPTGTFRGYYTHIELRQALLLGYNIIKVHKTYYYTKTCEPFKDYVTDLYNKRLEYKKNKSPMEKVVKILLNSLYGKFGQKFKDKDNLLPFNLTAKELSKLKFWEFVDENKKFIRIRQDWEASAFCIPIWASYVTAYGRLKLHNAMIYSKPVYVDTDSLITKKSFEDSLNLGDLKLEMYVNNGLIIKPKFYLVNDIIKSKGIGTKIKIPDFFRMISEGKIEYTRFIKIKESLRRGLIPNEIVSITKHLNLNDDKRIWEGDFNPEVLEHSQPISVRIFEDRNMTESQITEMMLIAENKYKKHQEDELKAFIDSDLFNKQSVGFDISPEEFIENEQDWRNE